MQPQCLLTVRQRLAGRKHRKKCDTCRNARRSDDMCKWMRKFLDGGRKTYRRENLVSPLRALYLDAAYKESLTRPTSNKLEEVLKGFNFGALTPKQKRCIELYFFDGLTEREIAKKLNKKQQTVNTQINRGINRLRKKYREKWLSYVRLWEEKNKKSDDKIESPPQEIASLNP